MHSASAFCPVCGRSLSTQFIPEEGRDRLVCDRGHIHYVNPKVVAGTIPVADGRIWLLRRAIEPRYGFWTFPAGFMEMGETVKTAAVRETHEELGIDVKLGDLLGVYSWPTVSSVHIVYAAEALTEPTGGSETLDFASFLPTEIPWYNLAFTSTSAALRDWLRGLR